MAFDPTKPVEDSPLDAAEMRNQLNALQEQITALQQQMTFLIPVLSFDSGSDLWNISFDGPVPAKWDIWKRCDYATDWSEQGTFTPSQLPIPTDSILAGDEVWWQVKVLALSYDDQPVTTFSNVISGGPVP